jgi:hypothetical protein
MDEEIGTDGIPFLAHIDDGTDMIPRRDQTQDDGLLFVQRLHGKFLLVLEKAEIERTALSTAKKKSHLGDAMPNTLLKMLAHRFETPLVNFVLRLAELPRPPAERRDVGIFELAPVHASEKGSIDVPADDVKEFVKEFINQALSRHEGQNLRVIAIRKNDP